MIWPYRLTGLRKGRHWRAGHYSGITVGPVPTGTWYPGPGMVRWCAQPSTPAVRDVGAIPGARSHPLVFVLRRNATSREPPGASVTDRGTASVHPMTVRAAGISGPITSRVTTDHRPAGPASDAADLIEHHSPAQSIASRILPGGDRRVSDRWTDERRTAVDRLLKRLSRRRAPGPAVRSRPSGGVAARRRAGRDRPACSGRPRRAPGRG